MDGGQAEAREPEGGMLPIKRKSPLPRGTPRPQQRASCGPTCSSPALGSWCARGGSGGADNAPGDEEEESRLSGEPARGGKAPRICAAGADVMETDGGGHHMGCCSRLSSASLTELEAATAAVSVVGEAAPAHDAAMAAERGAGPALAAAVSGPPQGTWVPGAWLPGESPACCPPVATTGQPAPAQQQQQQQQQLAAGCSPWVDVPDDVLQRILDRMAPSALRVLRLVCRGWEAAVSRQLRHLRPCELVGKRLGERFPALRSLDLSNAAMGVDFATPRALRLQSLLRDEHLAELAGLTRLAQLSLRGCSRLSGRGLAELGRLKATLTMLNLSNCTGITDECLAELAAATPRLATLNLQGCSCVGDAGIARVAAMPALRHVLLPAGVSDASMLVLAAGMPALERVALRGCSRVTTAGIYSLLQRRGLKRVVISKCPLVALEGLCGNTTLKIDAEGAAPARGGGAPGGAAAAALAGPDMQLLVADVAAV